MKHVKHSTVPVEAIVKQPAGTIVFVELEHGASASQVQNLLAGRARTAGVKLRTRTHLLIDTESMMAAKVIRVEVQDGQ